MPALVVAGESRSGGHRIRPSRNQLTIAAGNQSPASQHIAFDDRLEPAGGIAPLFGDAIGAIDDGGDFAACGARLFAIKGNERIAELESFDAPRPVDDEAWLLAMDEVRERRKQADGVIESGQSLDQEPDVDGAGCDERSGDVEDDLRRCPFEDEMLAAKGVEMQMSVEGQAARFEVKLAPRD